MTENYEYEGEDIMLEDEIEIRDLVGKGAKFTLRSNLQEYRDEEEELFPERLTGEEGISLDNDVIISPWDKSFAELIPLMTNIGDKIYKKIVKPPVDNAEIVGRSRVKIHYNAYSEQETSPFDSTHMRGTAFTFVTHVKAVLPGLEKAVLSMKKGEESQFIIPYEELYGKQGCEPRIKKEADILFVIELIDFSEMGDEDATEKVPNEDKRKYRVMIDKIMEVKASGIHHFQQGSYVKAAAAFHRAINRLEMCQLANEKEELEQKQHLITLYINAMISYNKMDNPKKACSAFNELCGLTDVNRHPKALFQHGKALLTLGDFARAKEALSKTNRLTPNDKNIVDQMKLLDMRHHKHKNTEKSLWRKAFGNDEPIPSEESVDVSESFKEAVNDSVEEFKNSPNKSKTNLPDCLTRNEIAYIRDLVKDLEMKLVTQDVQGKRSCFLVKTL